MRWYKNVPTFARQLVEHAKAGLRPEVMIIRRHRADFEKAFEDNDAGKAPPEHVGVVLRLIRSTASGTTFTTYQLWEFERWNYWRCREQMKMLIAYCEQLRVSVVGHELDQVALDQLVACKKLPITLLDRLGAVTWHPEDYASFRFEVRQERKEWTHVASEYRKSLLSDIAMEGGGAPLPDKPWEPGEPFAA